MHGPEILAAIGGVMMLFTWLCVMVGNGSARAEPALIIGGVGVLLYIIAAALNF
jgi:hypothetical protein